jgi:putative transposase
MPRRARLDAPGTLHHVMVRGIEKKPIVEGDRDREDFIRRMGEIALETETGIYAWALLTNHAHILIRSGPAGISTYMRRLLSGYAISFNLRHRRNGYLFQNRYKSIVCEEDTYFKELVRYIHLNPLRAKLVHTPIELARYPWCGHCVVLGLHEHAWHDREYVLKWFGGTEREAKARYREFVRKGIAMGSRPELTGGGLIRSLGGWSVVKSVRRLGVKEKGDERILGSGQFVEKLLGEAEEKTRRQFSTDDLLERARMMMDEYCRQNGTRMEMLRSGVRRPPVPRQRAELAIKLVTEMGLSLAETGRQLCMTASGVEQILRRRSK